MPGSDYIDFIKESIMRGIYKLLSYVWIIKSLRRGPGAFVRQRARSYLIKKFAMSLRRILKP